MIDNNKPTVVWDWNGTLINDMHICVRVMNGLLSQRKKPELTIDRYREIFTFPVKEYYQAAGFDFAIEDFEKPAMEFIDGYHELLPSAKLFDNVAVVLNKVKDLGYNQLILSAMEEESLRLSVNNLKINGYFDEVAGITDHFAASKVQRARQVIEKYKLKKQKIVLLGDTLHDKEVADELGCKCILIAKGHQSVERLNVNGNLVSDDISQAFSLIKNVLT